MSKEQDGRMFWVRMLGDAEGNKAEHLEAELASEVLIPGMLVYRAGEIVSRCSTMHADGAGLYKYALRLRVPAQNSDSDSLENQAEDDWSEGTRDGYLFRAGPLGELAALFSLFLHARLYLVARSGPPLMDDGVRIKTEFGILRGRWGPQIDDVVFRDEGRNFTELAGLLDDVVSIPPKYHQRLVTAADHYGRALRYIGVDEEMVYVRLVSAVEAAARDQPISDDVFEGVTAEQVMRFDALDEHQEEALRSLFRVRNAKKKFVAFLKEHSARFFDREVREPAHTQVTPENLHEIAGAIYNARSAYLHNGDPMFISPGLPTFPSWHMAAFDRMTQGDRKFVARQKLPYVVFFHRFVRHCLLNYFRSLVPKKA